MRRALSEAWFIVEVAERGKRDLDQLCNAVLIQMIVKEQEGGITILRSS